jgi:hypothetical protein
MIDSIADTFCHSESRTFRQFIRFKTDRRTRMQFAVVEDEIFAHDYHCQRWFPKLYCIPFISIAALTFLVQIKRMLWAVASLWPLRYVRIHTDAGVVLRQHSLDPIHSLVHTLINSRHVSGTAHSKRHHTNLFESIERGLHEQRATAVTLTGVGSLGKGAHHAVRIVDVEHLSHTGALRQHLHRCFLQETRWLYQVFVETAPEIASRDKVIED